MGAVAAAAARLKSERLNIRRAAFFAKRGGQGWWASFRRA